MSGASAAGALMSVLWTRGCAGSGSARVLAAHSGSFTSGAIPPVPAWPLQVLAQGTQKSWFDDDLSRVHFRAAYCTRVGVYWSGVVRTARIPGPCGVHPTLCQWIPTLAQFGWCQVSDGRAEALIELDPRPGAPCTPEPACSSTPRPGVSRFCSPVSTTLRSRPPGASTSA